jgi:subtilisin family serine protease
MRYLWIIGIVWGFLIASVDPLWASPFTPLEWQRLVKKHPDENFIGQRKHTTWIRDRNRNFIDDEIDRLRKKLSEFDIIVDLNAYLTPDEIKKKFEPYGRIRYMGKMITFVLIDNVKTKKLDTIAKMPEVAMIEIQQVGRPAVDISARAVQAKASQTYANSAAAVGYTGKGINIAIIDTGVDDDHQQLLNKRIAGFDATIFEDTNSNGIDDSCEPAPLGNGNCTDPDDEPADGNTDPDDDWIQWGRGHGTLVAAIAMGQGAALSGFPCGEPIDGSAPNNCAGVAPEAGLVDIKVCHHSCPAEDITQALDWLGLNHDKFDVRVANMSLIYTSADDCAEDDTSADSECIYDDDGTSALSQQANYLSALGLVMVAAHGNSSGTPHTAGTQLTPSPGSASFALTVAGTSGNSTISRLDDSSYAYGFTGPRSDFDPLSPNLLALKPDISAPAAKIFSARFNTTNEYVEEEGTSMAAPHVSGAAAIILQAKPGMDPGSVKDLIRQSADTSKNGIAEYQAIDPQWDPDFGSGMLNVWGAINSSASTDVGFPTCSGPPAHLGKPCALSGGLPFWNNHIDIGTQAPPQVGIETVIDADVHNFGSTLATVRVNFGVYIFAAGNNQFFHIGTQQVAVPANSTLTVSQPWTPAASDHQCIQVSIDYGLDLNFNNNVTQRNLQVAPSNFAMRVENPFTAPADFKITARSHRAGWKCRVNEQNFSLHPYRNRPKEIQVTFQAPEDAPAGARSNCDISVYAKPQGSGKESLIGGVTVQTFVPKPCRIIGWVRDERNRPLPGVKLILKAEGKAIETQSDPYGFVSFEGIPYRSQSVTIITEKYGTHHTKIRPYCGAGTFEIMVTEKGLTIETHRRAKDWAWDSSLKEGYGPEYREKQ